MKKLVALVLGFAFVGGLVFASHASAQGNCVRTWETVNWDSLGSRTVNIASFADTHRTSAASIVNLAWAEDGDVVGYFVVTGGPGTSAAADSVWVAFETAHGSRGGVVTWQRHLGSMGTGATGAAKTVFGVQSGAGSSHYIVPITWTPALGAAARVRAKVSSGGSSIVHATAHFVWCSR